MLIKPPWLLYHIGIFLIKPWAPTPYSWACTANDWPVRIQYKCLVPVYVFPEMKLLFPKHRVIIFCFQFPHAYICERFIYFQDRPAYSAAGKYVDRSWKYINCTQTHECGNWDWGPAISRKEYIHTSVRPLSVSFFIEKEPHKQLRMKRKRKGER